MVATAANIEVETGEPQVRCRYPGLVGLFRGYRCIIQLASFKVG